MVQGPSSIDLCASLTITATIDSPRAAAFTWACLNDDNLNGYLSTVSGDNVYLGPGTSQMVTADKTYIFSVGATDFLGSASDLVTFSVLKQSSAAPELRLSPVSLSITRDKTVLVKGQAVFSSCPVAQSPLSFSWRQVSGPSDVPVASLASLPQLYIGPNILTPGATYVFGLRLTVNSDQSQSSESLFTLKVQYQQLQAVIDGGSSSTISSSSGLFLSAADSRDLDSGKDPLLFKWSCLTSDGSQMNPCYDQINQEKLVLPSGPYVNLPAGSLLASIYPYVFQVQVSKSFHSPAVAQKYVTVLDAPVPILNMGLSCERSQDDSSACCIASNGAVLANIGSRLTLSGTSDDSGVVFQWTTVPVINTSAFPLGRLGSTVVIQGRDGVLLPGTAYSLYLQGSLNGNTGIAEADLLVNSPPAGGRCIACLFVEGNTNSACTRQGTALVDTFRFSCVGWADPDGLPVLMYKMGFSVDSQAPVWFDFSSNAARDFVLPQGSVTFMAIVQDECGGLTPVVQDMVLVSNPQRRQAADSNDVWSVAVSKVESALQLGNTDVVNQLAVAIATEADRDLAAGSADAVALKAQLVGQVGSSASSAVQTNGYVCETLGVLAMIVARPADMNSATVRNVSSVMLVLIESLQKGAFIPSSCAASGVAVLDGMLLAQADNVTILAGVAEVSFMQVLENGLSKLMANAAVGSVAGEVLTVSTNESVLSSSMHSAPSLSSAVFDHTVPTALGRIGTASFRFPYNFSVSAKSSSDLVVLLVSHSFAPGLGAAAAAGLYGISLLQQSGEEVLVQNLVQPVEVSLPVKLENSGLQEQRMFSAQAVCAFWTGNDYSTRGCTTVSVTLERVICACNHLTLFTVLQNRSLPACCDVIIQPPEECDSGAE